jgi:hypothetical protein
VRPGRNPRRGYDEEGREITPATVASTQRNGARGITARCACNHEALLPFEGCTRFVPDVRPVQALSGFDTMHRPRADRPGRSHRGLSLDRRLHLGKSGSGDVLVRAASGRLPRSSTRGVRLQ